MKNIYRKLIDYISSNKASALVMVLILISVLLALSASIVTYARSGAVLTEKSKDGVQAYYIARSGAEAVAAWKLNDNNSNLIRFAVKTGERGKIYELTTDLLLNNLKGEAPTSPKPVLRYRLPP